MQTLSFVPMICIDAGRVSENTLYDAFLCHLNAIVIEISYFKQTSSYCKAINVKVSDFKRLFHLFLFRNPVNRTSPKTVRATFLIIL